MNRIKRLFQKKEITSYIYRMIRFLLISGLCFIILYPLFERIAISFMSYVDLVDPSVRWIPRNPTLENYRRVYVGLDYWNNLSNSLLLAFSVSLMQLISCILVGYGFARYEFRGKKIWFGLAIFTFIVPPQIILIPTFLNFRFFNFFGLFGDEGFNLIGSYWPFLLPAITATGLRNGLFIFVARQFYIGMPNSLEEAAYVDGAGPLKTFTSVMLPSSGPIIIIVFLLSFVWQYNDMILTTVLTGQEGLLQFALASIHGTISRIYEIENIDTEEYTSVIQNTGIIFYLAPVFFIYLLLQRYFVESIQRTGIVG